MTQAPANSLSTMHKKRLTKIRNWDGVEGKEWEAGLDGLKGGLAG